ncbi:MAG: hypothetical protein LKJ28_06995 [Bifidobacteriaceae bacterium]|nr:hypothetical protein [Bifidobacteriaceae bacterium]
MSCANGHTFDISRKGYVDLRKRPSESSHYTDAFFNARLRMMHRGMYSDLVDRLSEVAQHYGPGGTSVDVGCGDGFITRALGMTAGIDISLEGIRVAARGGGSVLWACGDGAHLPLVDAAAAYLLNVFAPSEYSEFSRVCPQGVLIKVVPGEHHMQELRKAIGLPQETHSEAIALFKEKTTLLYQCDAIQTTVLDSEEERRDVAQMSPVGFDRVAADSGWEDLENITTHSRILVGRLP